MCYDPYTIEPKIEKEEIKIFTNYIKQSAPGTKNLQLM